MLRNCCEDGVTKLASPLMLSTIDAYAKIGLPERKRIDDVATSPVIAVKTPLAPASGICTCIHGPRVNIWLPMTLPELSRISSATVVGVSFGLKKPTFVRKLCPLARVEFGETLPTPTSTPCCNA